MKRRKIHHISASGTRDATTFLRGDATWAVPAGGGGTYTDEQVRDVVGAALVPGSGATVTVNDAGDTITIAADPEFIRDTVGTALIAGSGVTVTVNDAGDTITIAADPEFVRDTMGTALVGGTGISITVDDPGNTITITATGGVAPTFIGCLANRTTNQTFSNGVAAVVQFNAADSYDTNAMHDPTTNNTRITIPAGKGGIWRFTAYSIWVSNSGGIRQASFSVNGATSSPPSFDRRVPNGTSPQLTSTDLVLVAGDYVELTLTQTGLATLDITTAWMSCVYLGAP